MSQLAAGSDDPRRWWVVAAVSLVYLPLVIDFYGIVVALPTIGRDLDSSTTSLAWTVNAFMLGMAGPLVAVGRLGDLFGRRRVMLAGLALFGAASVACGLAQVEWQLIAARAAQGVGSAMLFALGLSIVSNAFSAEARSVGIGVLGAVGGAGSAIGPLVGGFLTQALSWRWFFFVNIPVIAIATALTLAKVEESKDPTAGRSLDLFGAGIVTAGFVLLVLGIQRSQIAGWSLPVLTSLLAGVALILAFVLVERRSEDPLVDLRFFKNPDFLGPAAIAFLGNYVFGAAMFFLTLYLQFILGYDPVRTGLFFLTFSIPFVLVGAISGKVDQLIGLRPAMAAGMLWLVLSFALLALIEPASGPALVIGGLLAAGVGQGLAYNLSTTAGMASIPEEKAGVGSGVLNTIRMVGLAVGVALTGVLVRNLEYGRLADLLSAAGASVGTAERAEIAGLLSGSPAAVETLARLAPAAAAEAERITRASYDRGFEGGMTLCLALSLVGVAVAMIGRKPQPALISEEPSRTA
jgi:EmrB/QacA subfamily drug resistance transporter